MPAAGASDAAPTEANGAETWPTAADGTEGRPSAADGAEDWASAADGTEGRPTDRAEDWPTDADTDDPAPPIGGAARLLPGQVLARGVCRHLASFGFAVAEEFVPDRGLRVDVMALGPKGELWVVECKSSRADFQGDSKWQGYLAYCDRYFWAVDQDFPTDLLPEGTGLIIADGYDAEILRMAPEDKLAAARRTKLVRKFAFHTARRLHALRDPDARRLV